MTTKDYGSFFKGKQAIIFGNTSDGQYSNLNLNQNLKFTSVNSVISKNVKTENKKVYNNGIAANNNLLDLTDSNKSKTRRVSYSWNNSKKIQPLYSLNHNFDSENEGLKEECDLNAVNKSTLSLYIETYENSFETVPDSFGDKNVGFKKNKNNDLKKQLFPGSLLIIQNPFEFPRQQEDEKVADPELTEFKASQKLLNPNESTPSKNAEPTNAIIEESAPASIPNDTVESPPDDLAEVQLQQPIHDMRDLILVTKEAEYETKFADRYKDANFQSKEKMPEPFIWVNMPSQKFRYGRNRQRDYEKKGKNNDDNYRDREPRGRYY